jgi:hypothetical protein
MEGIQEIIGGIGENVGEFISEKPIISAAIGAGVIGAGVIGVIAATSGKKSKKKTKRGYRQDRKFISKQKHERNRRRKRPAKIYKRKGKWYSRTKKAGNHKSKTRRYKGGIRFTKNGQPYKIMSDGKARFIKKKGVRK